MSQKQKYPYIAEQIIQKIEDGIYPVNGELPTLDELTKIYKVSRMTAQRALKMLSEKGYVSARRGNKTKIISPKPINQLSLLKGKSIGILGHFDVATYSTATMPLKILYFLQQKLTDLGNHVMCFQYMDDLDLRVNDFDCYIMIDMLGYRHKYKERLKATGKPFAVVENMSREGCMPNHVHPVFAPVALQLLNHFLKKEIKHLVIGGMDCKSVSKNMDEDEFRSLNANMVDRLVGPLLQGLENHGFPMANIHLLNCGFQSESAAKMTEELIRDGVITENTAFITISENSAIGICNTLKKYNWRLQDFAIAVFDPIVQIMNSLPGVIGVEMNFDEILMEVIDVLEQQFANKSNFAAGGIIRTSIRKHALL